MQFPEVSNSRYKEHGRNSLGASNPDLAFVVFRVLSKRPSFTRYLYLHRYMERHNKLPDFVVELARHTVRKPPFYVDWKFVDNVFSALLEEQRRSVVTITDACTQRQLSKAFLRFGTTYDLSDD